MSIVKYGSKLVTGKSQISGATGAPNGTGVTAIEGMGELHTTVINLSATALTGADNGDMQFAQKIYDCSDGSILIMGATADFTILGSGGVHTDGTGYWAVGTETCATLAGNDKNIIAKSGQFTLSSFTEDVTGRSAAIIDSGAPFDGSSTAIAYYLNLLIDAAGWTTAGTLTITGTVTLTWLNLGDY